MKGFALAGSEVGNRLWVGIDDSLDDSFEYRGVADLSQTESLNRGIHFLIVLEQVFEDLLGGRAAD